MGTLASALRPIAGELADAPRVYVDANMPAGVVEAMRRELRWDVLFVLEHDDLRRASDREHFQRALDYGRTLITLDRDFANADRFPPEHGPGVIVCWAPDEIALLRLMRRIDRELLRPRELLRDVRTAPRERRRFDAVARPDDSIGAHGLSMSERIFLSGASLVLPGRIVSGHTLVLEAGRIADMVAAPSAGGRTDVHFHLPAHYVLPGFIDVHVHGLSGHDVLDSAEAMATVAASLPRFGVTAFCPTSLACSPEVLDGFLDTVSGLRRLRRPVDARVIGAHVESNFISPEYRGAQPAACLRAADPGVPPPEGAEGTFTGADVIAVLDRHRPDVGVVTLAPEVPGALALTRRLSSGGTRVSLGHSAATFEIANEAIAAGARHATHLFNRMPPMTHYSPGLAGAVLASDAVAAELICDGSHVHPAFLQMAIAAKGVAHVMAITDGTAGSGLPLGSRARIGGQSITVGDVARLDDGTTAGSVATMDSVLRYLVGPCGLDMCDAAQLCATTPARELGLIGYGAIAPGATADLVVLDSGLNVVQTWIGGVLAWCGTSIGPESSPSS